MFRLASLLGWADVDELEDSISENCLQEWSQFYSLEPWGSDPQWLRTGVVAATVVNTSANRRPNSKPAEPLDFMPQSMKPDLGLDSKRIREEFMGAFAGRIKVKGDAD